MLLIAVTTINAFIIEMLILLNNKRWIISEHCQSSFRQKHQNTQGFVDTTIRASLKICSFREWEHSTCWERYPDHRYISEGYGPHWTGDAPSWAAGGPASHRAGSDSGETGICCGQAEDWDATPACQRYD